MFYSLLCAKPSTGDTAKLVPPCQHVWPSGFTSTCHIFGHAHTPKNTSARTHRGPSGIGGKWLFSSAPHSQRGRLRLGPSNPEMTCHTQNDMQMGNCLVDSEQQGLELFPRGCEGEELLGSQGAVPLPHPHDPTEGSTARQSPLPPSSFSLAPFLFTGGPAAPSPEVSPGVGCDSRTQPRLDSMSLFLRSP